MLALVLCCHLNKHARLCFARVVVRGWFCGFCYSISLRFVFITRILLLSWANRTWQLWCHMQAAYCEGFADLGSVFTGSLGSSCLIFSSQFLVQSGSSFVAQLELRLTLVGQEAAVTCGVATSQPLSATQRHPRPWPPFHAACRSKFDARKFPRLVLAQSAWRKTTTAPRDRMDICTSAASRSLPGHTGMVSWYASHPIYEGIWYQEQHSCWFSLLACAVLHSHFACLLPTKPNLQPGNPRRPLYILNKSAF